MAGTVHLAVGRAGRGNQCARDFTSSVAVATGVFLCCRGFDDIGGCAVKNGQRALLPLGPQGPGRSGRLVSPVRFAGNHDWAGALLAQWARSRRVFPACRIFCISSQSPLARSYCARACAGFGCADVIRADCPGRSFSLAQPVEFLGCLVLFLDEFFYLACLDAASTRRQWS